MLIHSDSDDEYCEKCPHSRFDYHRIGAGARVQTIIKEAAQCVECNLLLQAVSNFKPGWIEANKDSKCQIYVEKRKTYTVKLLAKRRDSNLIGSFQYIHRSKDEPFYEAENLSSEVALQMPRAQALEIIPDSSSQPALDRASKWLAHCIEHDEACELPSTGFMPRLLIDVGSQNDPREPFLYKPTQVAPYACLSYCWGPDTEGVLRTTTENVKSHHESIPFSKLPLGIQDAITVCRGLKISNLWVDSLCIVQDDSVSWHENASQMDRIYLHSRLTIAALEPATCKSRFLGPQKFANSDWQSRFTADIPLRPNESSREIFVRPWHKDDAEYIEDFTPSSLDKRGWCLQESLLPTRRLCFNGNEMTWECLCRIVCECGHILWKAQPAGLGRLGTHLKSKRLKAEPGIFHPQPARPTYEEYHTYDYARSAPGYPEKSYRRWRDIVMEYTKRSLTLQKDKLTAVSGLAKLVREGFPEDQQGQGDGHPNEYLAGLWRREFHFDLAWMVEAPKLEASLEKQTKYGAGEVTAEETSGIPSWSWASVEAPVTYRFDKPLEVWKYQPYLIECARLESASCQRELVNEETSNVISGQAVLTGLAARVDLAVMLGEEESPQAFVRSANLHAFGVQLDRQRGLTILPGDRQEACWKESKCQHGNGCCKRTIDGHDDRLLCLVLFSWTAPTKKTDDNGNPGPDMGPETWFLVLKRSASAEGAFERIGIGCYFHRMGERCKLFEDGETATVRIV
ncbi:heterokaryon incompatibility domain-containing protein [Trichoderma barbatum]